MADRTKTVALRYIHHNDHFINDFLSKYPSGRFRTVKHRTMWGRGSFLCHLIHVLNDTLFQTEIVFLFNLGIFYTFFFVTPLFYAVSDSSKSIHLSIHKPQNLSQCKGNEHLFSQLALYAGPRQGGAVCFLSDVYYGMSFLFFNSKTCQSW